MYYCAHDKKFHEPNYSSILQYIINDHIQYDSFNFFSSSLKLHVNNKITLKLLYTRFYKTSWNSACEKSEHIYKPLDLALVTD